MLLEVGSVVRAHGLRGQVVVELTTNVTDRAAVGATFVADGRVLEVVASAVAPAGTGHARWLVSFAGVSTREAADALRGTLLLAESIDDPDELWVHDLIGARVVEVDGTERGTVTDVLANPASDLLVLDTGALVPLRFVTGREAKGDTEADVVTVEVPDGLWDVADG